VTTLLDAKQYTRDDLAELYHQRWLAEIDIRAIKATMGMDVLRSKSPEMVRREVWTCLLAYNLIRQTILNGARASGLSPRQLSFTAAMQQIASGWIVVLLSDELTAARIQEVQLEHLAEHEVGHRPDRIEPRAIKRRPKPHKLLTKPRDQARAEMLAGKA
jgi:hypothetical protein